MARITPSALVDDIKGSVGGVTFSSWKGLTYVKAKAKSVRNPATQAQVQVRNGMAFFSRRYFDTLTDAQRAGWDILAQEQASAERSDQVQGGFGQRVVPKRQFQRSGYNWYIAVNVRLLKEIGSGHFSAPIDNAPIGQTPPSQVVITLVTYDAPNGQFKITFVEPQTFGDSGTVKMALWVLPNYAYSREQAVYDGATPGQIWVDTIVDTLYIQRAQLDAPLPDGLYSFQMDAVGVDNGLFSPPSEIAKVKAVYAPGP